MGGDAILIRKGVIPCHISIHAPRVGGDSKNRQIMQLFLQKTNDFYKHYSEVIPNNEVAVHFTKNDSKNLVRSYRAFLFA